MKVPIGRNDVLLVEVVAKLKREFHEYSEETIHTFSCKVKMTNDVYHPKVSTTKTA
jgi:hypothetical protein